MPALMANRLVSLLVPLVGVLVSLASGACGKEIGDACNTSQDCSPNGDRICDPEPNSPGGYCTVYGCDYSTCPGSSECVRFFTSSFENRLCTTTAECENGVHEGTAGREYLGSLDELCSIAGQCVSRSSEFRYCMKTCDSDGDCRDGYECRTFALMKTHGGEPVLAPPGVVDANAPRFCAAAPGA
jgi:hypothetical protein